MPRPIIEMRNVGERHGDFQALKTIDFRVEEGDRIVICGPSGSGESTLIRTLNWLEAHQEGMIVVYGAALHRRMKDIDKAPMDVGMVFQRFNLFSHMTVLENLMAAPMRVRGVPEAEARRAAWRFLERGRIVEEAEPDSFFANPRHERTKLFLSRILQR